MFSTAEVWGPPLQGAQDASWTWRELPQMSFGRQGCRGCVLSDGRFIVIGGFSSNSGITSSCEVMSFSDDGDWQFLPPMHDSRSFFVCVAVAGCIIVVGGAPQRRSAEVFDEVLGRWLRLPCDLPNVGAGLDGMGSALM